LNSGSFSRDPGAALGPGIAGQIARKVTKRNPNAQCPDDDKRRIAGRDQRSRQRKKVLATCSSKRPDHQRFSVEHPIHQDVFTPRPETAPFDDSGNFKAKNVLLLATCVSCQAGAFYPLESRCFLGTGLPLEQALWLYPFVTDDQGAVQWLGKTDTKLVKELPATQLRQGAIPFAAGQSCVLDFSTNWLSNKIFPAHLSRGGS